MIRVSKLHLRELPDRSSRSIGLLSGGTVVTIRGQEGGWLEITHKGKTGYIRFRDRYVHLFRKKKAGKIRIQPDTEPDGALSLAHPTSPPSGSRAEETVPDIHTVEAQAADIQQRISRHASTVKSYTRKEEALIQGLNDIERSLNTTEKRIKALRQEITEATEGIQTNQSAVDEISLRMRSAEAYMERRLISLYKLQRLGKMQAIAAADSVYAFLIRKNALEHILEADAEILDQYAHDRNEYLALNTRLTAQKSKKEALQAESRKQARLMIREKKRRSQLLAEIQSKKSLALAAIDALKTAAAALDGIIADMQQQTKTRAEHKPARPFARKKGLLNMPVDGKIGNSFGPSRNDRFSNVVTFQSGIDILAERGDPFRAVSSGKVLYASWFKGYGNMLIINHGDNYYTLYAHAAELFKQKGDPVEQNEVVGTVGDTGSMTGHKLHFEIRHHGTPVNPKPWFKSG